MQHARTRILGRQGPAAGAAEGDRAAAGPGSAAHIGKSGRRHPLGHRQVTVAHQLQGARRVRRQGWWRRSGLRGEQKATQRALGHLKRGGDRPRWRGAVRADRQGQGHRGHQRRHGRQHRMLPVQRRAHEGCDQRVCRRQQVGRQFKCPSSPQWQPKHKMTRHLVRLNLSLEAGGDCGLLGVDSAAEKLPFWGAV